MDQQTMDKLMEIKKLYEAGVLTKEEMEAEKAKVLHPASAPRDDSVKEEETEKPKEIASEAKPLATDSLGHFIFDEPKEDTFSDNNVTTKEDSVSQPETTTSSKPSFPVISTVFILVVGFILVAIAMCSDKGTPPADESYDTAVDSAVVDDTSNDEMAVYDRQEETPPSYAEKAEEYMGGLDTDTRVVASLTDDERHCVYTLTEVELGYGRAGNLYCHDLETGNTNLVTVPYKVEGDGDEEQIADAKMVGDNLYVVNTSYRCGQSVACLNTLTGNWSCVVRACASADFIGGKRLKVCYAELVYEGECLADNQYEYTEKVITLK